jgi:hypothetical protein
MGTELPTKVMLGQTLVLMQMTFLNNVRKVGRLGLSRISCLLIVSWIPFAGLLVSIRVRLFLCIHYRQSTKSGIVQNAKL